MRKIKDGDVITVLEDKPYRILKKWFRDVGFDNAAVNWIGLDSDLDPVWYVGTVKPDYLLLTGAKALSYFQPKLKLTECRGKWWRIDGLREMRPTWCLATYHPAAVLRNRELESQVKSDIANFRFHSYGVFDPAESQECIKCGGLAIECHYGFKFCPKHKPKEEKVQKVITKKKGQWNQEESLFK